MNPKRTFLLREFEQDSEQLCRLRLARVIKDERG
jgi:hypothetical protein